MVLLGYDHDHHIGLLILLILLLEHLVGLLGDHQGIAVLGPLRQDLIELLIHRVIIALRLPRDIHYGFFDCEAQEQLAALFGVEEYQLAVVL